MCCLLSGDGVIRIGLAIPSFLVSVSGSSLRARGGMYHFDWSTGFKWLFRSCVLFGSGPRCCDCVSFDA